MYRTTLIFFSIIVAMTVVEDIVASSGLVNESVLTALDTFDKVAGLVISIIPGIFGNTWYLAHAKREIARIRDSGLKDDAYYEALARRGGTNIFASIGLFSLFIAALVAVSVIAYELSE